MISDNIRYYRKANNMSQDELAEKLGVSRQSISLWENGQTQPAIENIIALAKIFNTSSDAILSSEPAFQSTDGAKPQKKAPKEKRRSKVWLIAAIAAVIVIVGAWYVGKEHKASEPNVPGRDVDSTLQPEAPNTNVLPDDADSQDGGSDGENNTGSIIAAANEASAEGAVLEPNKEKIEEVKTGPAESETGPTETQAFDLFTYCKDFAIQKGNLKGDHCIYQQPAARYSGYDNEYFSISYWGDSDMVEFCLHCPLNETLSINFYLRMRGGYDQKYEYLSSKYYRDNGESLRYAMGYIDPAVFSDMYPLSCDKYEGGLEGQDDFMEESRVGICDLIHCLKEFVKVENMECSFSDFDFVNF